MNCFWEKVFVGVRSMWVLLCVVKIATEITDINCTWMWGMQSSTVGVCDSYKPVCSRSLIAAFSKTHWFLLLWAVWKLHLTELSFSLVYFFI